MASAGEKSSPYKITQGLEVLYAGENGDATVDIIAVPGLGSNPDTAFDSFKKTIWRLHKTKGGTITLL